MTERESEDIKLRSLIFSGLVSQKRKKYFWGQLIEKFVVSFNQTLPKFKISDFYTGNVFLNFIQSFKD